MELSPHISHLSRMMLIVGSICLLVAPVFADSYRWKDKEGKTHYGATVPAEYADQPYDVLNNAGIVIERVEDTRQPLIVKEEPAVKKRAPLISDEERKRQSDRLLVIQYQSEEAILETLELKIAQLGYDSKIINQSYDSTTKALTAQIRVAADQQRAGKQVTEDQQQQIDKLYRRLGRDVKRIAALDIREARIRARFKSDLERYQQLTGKNQDSGEEQESPEKSTGQG